MLNCGTVSQWVSAVKSALVRRRLDNVNADVVEDVATPRCILTSTVTEQDLIHAASRSTVNLQCIHEASQTLSSDIQLQTAMAQLAHEDKMAYTEIFLKVDAESGNGDGALTMDEFEKLMIFCGHRVPKADITRVFMQMDKDENWKITLDEFLAVLPRLSPPDSADFVAARVRRIFDVYDVNKDGYVTQEEFQIIMSKAGQPLSQNQIHDLIARCDKDGDGKLNFEEFLTIYVAQ